MHETGLLRRHRGHLRDLLHGFAAVLEHHIGCAPADPEKRIVLGRRDALAIEAVDPAEVDESGRHFVGRQAAPEVRAECDHEVHAAG